MTALLPTRWPVKLRIAAVSAALTFLILLTFAFVVGRLAVDKLEANFDEEAQSSANDVANRLQLVGDPATGERAVTNRDLGLDDFVLPRDDHVQVVEATGQPINVNAPRLDLGQPREEPRQVRNMTVASQQIPTGSFGGEVFVQYARGRSSLDSTIGRIWLFLGLGVLGGTLLAALSGYAIARRAMLPISSLTAAAREVTRTRDPSRRLPMPHTDDEVAELARTLDEMLRELDAARAETELMIQTQREFVADASHELRTPLTSILANLELLQERLAGADPEDEEIVAGALGSSRRMRRLVSDLLLLARADAGRPGARRPCDLVAIAREAVAEVRSVSYGHTFMLDESGPAMIDCNPDDMHRLVLNLTENAVRHTPPDSDVRISVRATGAGARLEVADNGPGLPPGVGDQIFARFVRGNGPADLDSESGTGLGLAIVKAVATSHGGTVEAADNPEGGATFTVTLPTTPSASDPNSHRLAADRRLDGDGAGDGAGKGLPGHKDEPEPNRSG